MVTGPFINASAVLVGGVLGALLSQRLPERIRTAMTSIFGLASLASAFYWSLSAPICR
ncbi:inner membrane protein YqgA [Klebsiella pneumoniae subsp. ozaenae]|uniref:Inner membrane protein YqgA n=1 Tax=Klebsiella pneumoniae subsp. ozaenae TaxID=574 RepID=A0A378APC7_KLEPO|nr:inner membrane protein YqgA [Klebsiella pneumoniae subsp. ozaenae]